MPWIKNYIMDLIKKFDIKVFIVLLVLTVGVDYFNDENFNYDDILYGVMSAFIGTVLWVVIKARMKQ